MESANTPAASENLDTMNLTNTQDTVKAVVADKPVQTFDTLMPEIDAKLKAGQLDEAVELYGTVMELSITKYEGDDLNPLLAENYARYGSLLLRVAIQNNDQNVLSSTNAATAGTPETTDALLKAASGDKKKLIEFSGDEDEEDEEDAEDGQEQENDNEGAAPEDAEEDDFTIAWENLDVARLLFEKRIEVCTDKSEESTLNRSLAFVYQDLGDLSLENEHFAESITEYELALKHFGTPSTEHLRDVAGIYFNLALALEFENRIPESKEQYRHAKEVLQRKEADILGKITSEDEKASEDTVSTPELSELRGLISEITLKIEDLDTNNQSAMSQELQDATNKAALAAAQTLNCSVNDLSGMIKKRKAEPVEAVAAKEVKIEEPTKVEEAVKVEEPAKVEEAVEPESNEEN